MMRWLQAGKDPPGTIVKLVSKDVGESLILQKFAIATTNHIVTAL